MQRERDMGNHFVINMSILRGRLDGLIKNERSSKIIGINDHDVLKGRLFGKKDFFYPIFYFQISPIIFGKPKGTVPFLNPSWEFCHYNPSLQNTGNPVHCTKK